MWGEERDEDDLAGRGTSQIYICKAKTPASCEQPIIELEVRRTRSSNSLQRLFGIEHMPPTKSQNAK